jgi:hypothetical protein
LLQGPLNDDGVGREEVNVVEAPLLERLGVRYFQRLSQAAGRVDAGDGVHYLNPDERHAMRRVERGAILRACAAGALSTVVSATAEVLAHPLLGPNPDTATVGAQLHFWAIVGAATAGASIVEIAYLYWDGLRSVHRLAQVAGLDLFPDDTHIEGHGERAAVAHAMARAALELPNPTAAMLGVDPRREASKLGLVVASILYKLKVSVSNFIIKALVRRMLGRAFVRAWLPFVAVPITAIWNGLVAWLVIREARLRAMGPSAVVEMVTNVLSTYSEPLSADGQAAVLRAVASSIVRTRDLHPNLVALLVHAKRCLGDADTHALDDSRNFLAALHSLVPGEQTLVLEMLSVAAIIDGRLTPAEKLLLRDARAVCGRSSDLAATQRLRRAFVAGDALDVALLRATAR